MRSVPTTPTTVERFEEDSDHRDEPDPSEPAQASGASDADEQADLWTVRVSCPDCAQPVALTERAQALPEHAWCPNPWQPFGTTVCAGSGRTVAGDGAVVFLPVEPRAGRPEPTVLPENLDWRLQPFSHAAPAAARPAPVAGLSRAA
ncbi:hypothetical protein [Streptomyces harbinensis]|uniref:Uncharacterized protein n=1 Tax=Streptomyces harbinensis TaxID=1176198 RepID=A0A1I6QY62_9ACTN|nr:hypothetical protein [Streptomyces harbinensis]QKV67719.1 hypothetical protein HUT13_02225 [Streptomyces harbinensis]SFS57427.1 hypothetical protein SAMN05444716_102465 [Streptomyces harbinensis]